MNFEEAVIALRSAKEPSEMRSTLERLRILTNPSGIEDKAIKAALPNLIVKGMQEHPLEPGVQEAGAGCLTNICGHEDQVGALERARAIERAGAFETVSSAITAAFAFADGDHSKYHITDRSFAHPEVSMVVVEGCAMLATCARLSPELRRAALAAGALPAWLMDAAPIEQVDQEGPPSPAPAAADEPKARNSRRACSVC